MYRPELPGKAWDKDGRLAGALGKRDARNYRARKDAPTIRRDDSGPTEPG